MNIFHIPSKYPSAKEPLAGIFFRDQALALGEKSPHKIIISLWGQNEYALPLNRPFLVIVNFISFFQAKPDFKKISKNVFEISRPALSWYHKFFGGNINKVIESNRRNFLQAQEKFGPINVIHAHLCYPGSYIAMKLAEEFKVPYIVTEHMGTFPYPFYLEKGRLPKFIREPLAKADQLIAVSSSLKKQMENHQIRNIKVIPNLADEDFFVPAQIRRKSFFTFFNLGNSDPEKGTEDLVRAIAEAVKSNPKLRFRIAGPGDYSSYKKIAEQLKIQPYIIWLGALSKNQVKKELQSCDVFILASRHESFGLVYVEAMACGKPVIATRCGGPESIVTRETGILVEVANIKQISRAMLDVANGSRKFNSQKIRKIFLNNFSKEAVTKKIIDCYKSLH